MPEFICLTIQKSLITTRQISLLMSAKLTAPSPGVSNTFKGLYQICVRDNAYKRRIEKKVTIILWGALPRK